MDYASFNSNQGFGGGDNSFSSSQFGGGGFVADGGDFGGSQSQKSPNQIKKRDAQTLVPLTIKQLQNSEIRDSKFKIDGKEVSQITFIGVILTVEAQNTNVNYLIDDGTGKINVRIYIDMDDETQKQSQWRENMYVRVIGNLRVFQNGPSVVGFQLIPLTDFNELTFHMLEVIHTHCVNTKTAQGGSPAKAPAAQSNDSNVISNSNFGNDGGDGAFSDIQKQVLQVFAQDHNNETGTSIQTVCERLSQFQRHDIQRAIEYLSDEGHLYSTIDEEHYKSTSAQ
jgi:replication factor A2